jgi:hypothetical protein
VCVSAAVRLLLHTLWGEHAVCAMQLVRVASSRLCMLRATARGLRVVRCMVAEGRRLCDCGRSACTVCADYSMRVHMICFMSATGDSHCEWHSTLLAVCVRRCGGANAIMDVAE